MKTTTGQCIFVVLTVAVVAWLTSIWMKPGPPPATPTTAESTSTVPQKISPPSKVQGTISTATSTAKQIAEPPAPQQPASDAITDASSILVLMNNIRVAKGLPILKRNALLDAAAQAHVNDMVAKDYFAHVSPDGKYPWDWIKAAGYKYTYAGENLGEGFSTASSLVAAWIVSPMHYANIISSNYADTGIGIATGTYQGQTAVFVVEMFGSTTK